MLISNLHSQFGAIKLLALDDLGPDVTFDQATDTAQHWAVVGEREQDSLGGLIPCLFNRG